MMLTDINDTDSLLNPLINDSDSNFDPEERPNKHSFQASCKNDIRYQNMIYPTFMYFLVLFASIPLSYQAIIQQICNEDQGGNDCSNAHVTSRASMVIVYCNIATYAPGLLTTGLYSSVANIYGRKSVMIISLIGVVIYSLIYCFIVMFDPHFYVALAIVASFVMGISGSYTTYIMGAFSYVADSTTHTPEERNRAYSVTESCLYLGKIVGPLVGGLYASYFGYIVPFLAAAVLSTVAIANVIYLPESLPPDAASRSQALVLNPLQVLDNIRLLFAHSPEHGRSPLPSVATAFFLYYFALMGFVVVVYVYMKHTFGWGALYFGIYDSVNGAIQAISMLYVPRLVHWAIGRDLRLVTWVHMGYFCRLVINHRRVVELLQYH
jgi:MFS family permease